MKNMTLQQIAQAVGGILREETKCADLTREAQGVVIDNRQVSPDDIFVAIRGAKVDGHSFIADAFVKGALGAIADHELDEAPGPYIVVKDTEQALKDLAAYYRGQIDAYVIGIIGSVGKTSTKEMVASVLEEHYTVLKTQGNFNNEIGLPLTLFRIRPEHQVAVVEMGISDFGEMDRLGAMARPDMVIMTNIGQCHLENLGTRDGILQAKTEVFAHMPRTGRVILNGDDDKLQTADTHGMETHFFGLHEQEVYGTKIVGSVDHVEATLHTPQWEKRVCIPIPGEHNVYNALAATVAGMLLDLSEQEIVSGIEHVTTISGRNHFIEANGMVVIDDCYNANPMSMRASLEVLGHAKGRKVAILGDMGELGTEEKMLHYQVGEAVVQQKIDLLLTAGPLASQMVRYVKEHESQTEAVSYPDKDALLNALDTHIKKGDTILIKASHFMNFTDVVNRITG